VSNGTLKLLCQISKCASAVESIKDVFDPRHIGRPSMVLIKYREGILYECFWFDSRKFNYSEGGWERPFFEHCLKDPRNFEMRRKALR
jgi:hypothetical protein